LRVGCHRTDESIWNASCNANVKAGGWSGIPLPLESSPAPAVPLVCGPVSGKVGDFMTLSILLEG